MVKLAKLKAVVHVFVLAHRKEMLIAPVAQGK